MKSMMPIAFLLFCYSTLTLLYIAGAAAEQRSIDAAHVTIIPGMAADNQAAHTSAANADLETVPISAAIDVDSAQVRSRVRNSILGMHGNTSTSAGLFASTTIEPGKDDTPSVVNPLFRAPSQVRRGRPGGRGAPPIRALSSVIKEYVDAAEGRSVSRPNQPSGTTAAMPADAGTATGSAAIRAAIIV